MPYQYVTVMMPYAQGTKEGVWTDRLNAVAADGWRLVSMDGDTVKGFTTMYATFEREIPHA